MGDEKHYDILIMKTSKLKLTNYYLRDLLLLFFTFIPTSLYCQGICFNYKGSWSNWESNQVPDISVYTDGSGFILKTEGGIDYFEVRIPSYTTPTKEELKEHKKQNKYFEYSGYVNYYVSDNYPTALDLAKHNMLILPDPRRDVTPTVQRHTNATIRIAPYDNYPEVYNVWFDGIGVGLSIKGIKFEGRKYKKNTGRIIANIAQSIFLFPIGVGSWWWNPISE